MKSITSIKGTTSTTGSSPCDTRDTLSTRSTPQRGFTFIELLVVLSIIGILSVASIAAFVDYSRKESLNAATKEVLTTLQTAKSRAQSQVKPRTGACVTSSLEGYKVTITGQRDYQLVAVCGGNPEVIVSKTLPIGITLSGVQTSTIFFRALTGGATDASIIVGSSHGQKTIDIGVTGTIKTR